MKPLSAGRALRAVLRAAKPLSPERVPLERALGRVLARDLRAAGDWPAFDNSSMDGFAVRSAGGSGRARGADRGGTLRVVATARAGGPAPRAVGRGEAVRIMTGAPLPSGADAVVPRELAEAVNGAVRVLAPPRPGEFVRRRGVDVRAGQLLLRRGTRLGAFDLALLASQGMGSVPAVRLPRVRVLSTGDELVPFRRRPGPGRIRDSSGPALAAAVAAWGYRVSSRGICPDKPSELKRRLAAAARDADVLLVLGGVSVGDFDYTRVVLEKSGLRPVFWKVAIRPGKPLLFGAWKGRLVFGLPGNPVSTLVCAEEFVRPALERLAGVGGWARGAGGSGMARGAGGGPSGGEAFGLSGRLVSAWEKPAALRQYLFCRARAAAGGWELAPVRPQGSAFLGMASRADALAVAPEGRARLAAGSRLRFRWL